MSGIDTSSWREFHVGDLFDIETPCKKINACEASFCSKENGHPYVVRSAQNNGIRGYIEADEAWLNPGNTISFGQDTGTMFYQPESYFTGDKMKIMSLVDYELSESIALYLIACLRRSFANFSWGQSSFNVNVLKDVVVKLPAKEVDVPDFAYMEQRIAELEAERIAELEAERIAELEAYFVATGLDDYELTEEDKEVLSLSPFAASDEAGCAADAAGLRKVEVGEFRVGDLFEVMNNPQLDKQHFEFNDKAEYPYFTRTENNNGVLGYVEYLDDEHKIPGNSLAVGMISMRFHYMSHDFYAGQFTKTLLPKFTQFNELVALYFIAELNARSPYYQGYLVREFVKRVSDTMLKLPITVSGEPDFEYMARYIKAQQKLVIRDAVKFKDEIIETTRQVVSG